jgi:putative membrane protein
MIFKEKLIIAIAYILNISFGILHIFSMSKELETAYITPLIIFNSILAIYFAKKDIDQIKRKAFYLYINTVAVFIWLISLIELKTGLLFGSISFGKNLLGQLLGVPGVFSLIWTTTLLTASAFVYTIGFAKGNINLSAMMTGLVMTVFTFLMEPAAIKLNYWSWLDKSAPVQYYLVWFLLGSLISYFGFRMNLLHQIKSKWLIHLAILQIIYFSLILIK